MDAATQVRKFNRTITQRLGVLNSDFLGRKRPIGASRLLFEVGEQGIEIRILRERLGLDSGYTSRLVNSLEKEGLLNIFQLKSDARVRGLKLTRAGRREVATLNKSSDEQARTLLQALNEQQQNELIDAIQTVERLYRLSSLSIEIENPGSASAMFCIQNYYHELAERFSNGFDPNKTISAGPDELELPRGCFVMAKILGEPVGCGALKLDGKVAQVKRMWVSPDHRGMGIGKQILLQLENIAKKNRVKTLRLETNKSLKEAQAMYKKFGYQEVEPFNNEPFAHHWFEKSV